MREIKFRAWDKAEKVMHDAEVLGNQAWNVLGNLQWGKGDWEFMQFTGLKDKNGKECYEGDRIIPDGSEIERIVEFRDGCFTQANSFPTTPLPKVFEIIGNIWESSATFMRTQNY